MDVSIFVNPYNKAPGRNKNVQVSSFILIWKMSRMCHEVQMPVRDEDV